MKSFNKMTYFEQMIEQFSCGPLFNEYNGAELMDIISVAVKTSQEIRTPSSTEIRK